MVYSSGHRFRTRLLPCRRPPFTWPRRRTGEKQGANFLFYRAGAELVCFIVRHRQLGAGIGFNLSGAFKADLQAAGEAVSPLKAYRPLGVIRGTAQGTPSAASADVTLEAVGAAVPYAGTLSDFTMRAVLTDLKDLQIPAFSGKLNGGDFDGRLSAAYNGKIIDADVAFHAARLALPAAETAASAQTAEREPAPVQDSTSGDASSFVLPPVNLKAKADIDSLDAPYIWGNDIHFAADLQGLTMTLDQAHGELALETGKGEIKDLNKLTNANILTRVMFGSFKRRQQGD